MAIFCNSSKSAEKGPGEIFFLLCLCHTETIIFAGQLKYFNVVPMPMCYLRGKRGNILSRFELPHQHTALLYFCRLPILECHKFLKAQCFRCDVGIKCSPFSRDILSKNCQILLYLVQHFCHQSLHALFCGLPIPSASSSSSSSSFSVFELDIWQLEKEEE